MVVQSEPTRSLRQSSSHIMQTVLLLTSVLWISGGFVFPWGIGLLDDSLPATTHMYFYASFLV